MVLSLYAKTAACCCTKVRSAYELNSSTFLGSKCFMALMMPPLATNAYLHRAVLCFCINSDAISRLQEPLHPACARAGLAPALATAHRLIQCVFVRAWVS